MSETLQAICVTSIAYSFIRVRVRVRTRVRLRWRIRAFVAMG